MWLNGFPLEVHWWRVFIHQWKCYWTALSCISGNQSWIFIGRTDTEAETPILWPPDMKNWLSGKDPDAGQDWRQEEKGTIEDEMVGWHHRLDGHEFEQAPGVGDGQESLVCCSPWGRKEWVTEWLNCHNELDPKLFFFTLNVKFYQ